MAKPPKLLLTLAEACTLVSERLRCSPEEAQQFVNEAIRSREVSLWDNERGRVIESFNEFTFNWEDSTISRTASYPRRAITDGETEADVPWQTWTTNYHVRIKYKDLAEFLGGDVAPEKRPSKSPAGKPGRYAKWDWVGAARYLVELAHHPDGLPTPQAAIERRLMEWFVKYYRDHPVQSQIREFVRDRLPSDYRREG